VPGFCWIGDTCSVYALAHGGETLLMDCGTRLTPGSEIAAGLGHVDRVLLTPFHRGQCSSAAAWRDAGAAITVPFTDKRFFEEPDLPRASYDVYDNYTSYPACRGEFHVADHRLGDQSQNRGDGAAQDHPPPSEPVRSKRNSANRRLRTLLVATARRLSRPAIATARTGT